MTRILRYAGVAYLGGAIAFVLPFNSGAYALVSTGAQAICIILGLDY